MYILLTCGLVVSFALLVLSIVAETRRWTGLLCVVGTTVAMATTWYARYLYSARWTLIWQEHISVGPLRNDDVADSLWIITLFGTAFLLLGIRCILQGIIQWWIWPGIRSAFQKIRRRHAMLSI